MAAPVFIKRVVLNNYKSIQSCSVELGPLTFLVGQNGAGKSNFIDALRLVTDSLNTSLEHALRDRGGIKEVRRKSSGHPTNFGIRLEWVLGDSWGWYAFRVAAQEEGGFEVQQEECRLIIDGAMRSFYNVLNGQLREKSFEVAPPVVSDRLYLVAAAGLPEFRPLYDALSHMGFYNLNPSAIRELQPADPGEVLKRDGSNLASVLALMKRENPSSLQSVVTYLSKVVDGIEGVDVKHVGTRETMEFRQRVGLNRSPWRFFAENMSDGTLRALGVLAALFQSGNGVGHKVPFIGIEEPEVALHPGAADILRDALQAASHSTQVAVTSHSPDLLDDTDIRDINILAVVNNVENRQGETIIGPLDEASRSSIRDNLYTAGELLRQNQLEADIDAVDAIPQKQLELFGE